MRFDIVCIAVIIFFIGGCTQHENRQKHTQKQEFLRTTATSYQQTMQILNNLGYTDKAFKKHLPIPRVMISHISKRWKKDTNKITISAKKSIFLRLLAPIALIADQEVLQERTRLLRLIRDMKAGPIDRQDTRWIRSMAKKYKVLKKDTDFLTPKKMKILCKRIDIVPPSIIVAQGAIESAWGTSRFAIDGNALFGQWSFSDVALKPKDQRKGLGNYGLATFKTPLDSVRAYLLNINTHPAYKEFRKFRAKLRKEKKPLSSKALAPTLHNYSEQKELYVEQLIKVIRQNDLSWLDTATLKNNRVVIIDPDV